METGRGKIAGDAWETVTEKSQTRASPWSAPDNPMPLQSESPLDEPQPPADEPSRAFLARLKRASPRRRNLMLAAAAALLSIVILASSALPQKPAQLPASAPDGLCEIIWESIGFFERVGFQDLRDSQLANYSRRCR